MKTKIQIAIALLVIVGVTYWAITSIWPRHYTGSKIMFPIGSGSVAIKNLGDAPIPLELRNGQGGTLFRVASPELATSESPKRQGSGRTSYYSLSLELPPGQAHIAVTRGSGVQLISRADTRIEATVTPMAANSSRWVLIAASGVILWALYYISKATEHRWVGQLRSRFSRKELQSSRA